MRPRSSSVVAPASTRKHGTLPRIRGRFAAGNGAGGSQASTPMDLDFETKHAGFAKDDSAVPRPFRGSALTPAPRLS